MCNNSTECTSRISEKAAQEILEHIAAVQSLTFALVTALECPLYTDNDPDSDLPVTGGQHFVVDQKAILAVFGETIHERFNILTDHIDRLKKFRELT